MSLLDDVSIVVTPNGYKAGELYAVIPTFALGSEEVSNGDLSNGTVGFTPFNSTIANVSNTLQITNTASYGSAGADVLTTIVGRRYEFSADVKSGTSTTALMRAGITPNGIELLNVTAFSITSTFVKHTFYFVATSTTSYVSLWSGSATIGHTIFFDNVSVKEYTSADMDVTRATAATRVDENGLVNYAEIIGGEEVTCGDFSCAVPLDSWSTGTGWSIGSGIASCDGSQTSNTDLQQIITITQGKDYLIEFNLIRSSGVLYPKVGNTTGTGLSSSQNVSQIIEAGSSNTLKLRADTNFIGSISNISVKEVTRDNVPRIDYTGGGCPHILAEPQRTNLVTYSEDFTDGSWAKQNATVSSGFTSPDGTLNATEILETAVSGNHGAYYALNPASGGTDYSVSMFVKKLNRRYFGLQSYYNVDRGAIAFFDLDTGTLLYEFAEGTDYTVSNSKIEDYGNGWYKISTTFQIPTSTVLYAGFVLADTEWTTGTSYDNPYTGDITKGAYIWGTQLEVGSYPTSLIPTSGSTVTRNQDIFTRDGIGSLINSTEGVLFAEFKRVEGNSATSAISLNDGTSSNGVSMYFFGVSNFYVDVFSSSGTITLNGGIVNTSDFIKVAFKYKNGDSAIWINGIEVTTNSGAISLVGLNQLLFAYINGTTPFFGKVKQLQVYDTALTDEQLEALTT